ncbi:MAG: hypothetical protein WCK80_00295 [bacterium]
MEKKQSVESQGNVYLSKTLKNYYMFFVPPLTDRENFDLPITTVVNELENREYPGGTVKKFKKPGVENVQRADEIFVTYSQEVSQFLGRVFDGSVHFMVVESEISQTKPQGIEHLDQ